MAASLLPLILLTSAQTCADAVAKFRRSAFFSFTGIAPSHESFKEIHIFFFKQQLMYFYKMYAYNYRLALLQLSVCSLPINARISKFFSQQTGNKTKNKFQE